MKKKVKVCHITSVHTRYDVRVFIKECISIAKADYDVTLIVADGLGDEHIFNVNIIDVGKEKGRFSRILRSSNKVYKKAKSINADIYHFHDPELMLYGLMLKSKTRKVVYDIHEDLAKQLEIKPWLNKFLKPIFIKLFKIIEGFVAKKMDGLIVPQPYMKHKYLKYNSNTVLVENFVILDNKNPEIEVDYSTTTAFHAGALTEERGLLNMLEVYSKIKEPNRLILAGNINSKTLNELKNFEEYDNVDYLGLIPFNEVSKYYKTSSIGLILYNNVGQYYLSYAIKLFEYMRNGIPVIMPDFGEWKAFNKENNCGINVDPTNHEEVVKAIEYLNNNPEEKKKLGANGRKSVIGKYNWNLAENRLLNLYQNL
ncbi:glycosyltransferase [Winogradskyella haliclonae]|uniref:Glycosyltransferase WbpH n=1 Tax=Winogradskyella haliclonae TaxID=2048558 RepID=A0ABQ2BZH8_9FLAO|nr:glycosyltransferase [Winogradskyella haliclonae]GGI56288.1 glycosyltransferase WbpH [Winogradskyella haliclonae]